jgi:hypothetical protein
MIASFVPQGSTVRRSRRAAGSSSYGIYIPGATTDTDITAVVVRGLETQELLPPGERTGEVVTIFTSESLFTSRAPAGFLADLIVFEGETYEVRAVRDLSAHGNFKEAAAVKVAQ